GSAQGALGVGGALARRDDLLDAVGEVDQADAVVVVQGGEGEQGGQLGDDLAHRLAAGAAAEAGRGVHEEQDGQLALLDVPLEERLAHAGGDVPVDGPDVVAGLVGADVGEGQAGALEGAVVLAAEQVLDGPAGAEVQAADLADDVG